MKNFNSSGHYGTELSHNKSHKTEKMLLQLKEILKNISVYKSTNIHKKKDTI
jgi:hypothetical protein